MRRVRYSVAMSLDGYIAGPKGEADWIVMDPEIDFGAIFEEFDTLLMGRRTFDATAKMQGGPDANYFSGMSVIVVSRTLDPRNHPGVTIVSTGLKEAVTKLRAKPGKDIWLFGGGDLFRSLLDLGLVDTVEVAVIPVLLGHGIPLLPAPAGRARLTLKSHRVFEKTGTLSLAYDVRRQRAARRVLGIKT
jgi:dihydrofolate reductase